ncbi:MAG: hypothetical protein N2318_12750, partial [Meiothermus sp.]|nr:hypothetical protein [Meiothermus sp.]
MLRWCWWMGSLWALSLGLSQPLTIDQLAQARYGGGTLSVERVLEQTQGVTRYLVRYPCLLYTS